MIASAETEPQQSKRGPRLANDPYRYVRFVPKARKYQARPYCTITKERYNLGLWPTKEAAARAIRRFWATGQGEKPKYIRPHRDATGQIRYQVLIPSNLGAFATVEAAIHARNKFMEREFGLFAAVYLSGQEFGSRSQIPDEDE